jgi:hypothetical protein
VLIEFLSLSGAVEEEGLVTDLGDHDVFAAFDHPSGYTLAQLVSGSSPVCGEAGRSFYLEVTGLLVEESYGAANDSVVSFKYFEHLMERGLQVESPGEGLARFHQGGEFPDFSGMVG